MAEVIRDQNCLVWDIGGCGSWITTFLAQMISWIVISLALSIIYFRLEPVHFMWVLVATGRYKSMFLLYTFGLILNLILNFVYIPKYSFIAASWITVISEYFILIMQIVVLWFDHGRDPFNMKLTIFTDGASRGNPGHASFGFTVSDESGKLLYKEGKYIGITTNNVAEYTGVYEALKFIKEKYGSKPLEVELYADSKLVVEQLSGRYKMKSPHLKPIFEQIKILAIELGGVIHTHIPRTHNSEADRLANLALDSR